MNRCIPVALAAWFALSAVAAAAPKADVQKLSAQPATVKLRGADDAAQIVVTAEVAGGRLLDLSGDVTYAVSDPKVAKVLPSGRVIGLANGSARITATTNGKTVSVDVTAEAMDKNLPINFGNQVVPVFTKLGCNSGGCHGKASGQNGFRLSLLGFDADLDYASLIKEGRGRRVVPAAPDASLLLTKATGTAPHGGGKKMERDSDEYRLVRRWIAAGLPFGESTDPTVTKITVFPEKRVLSRDGRQQLAVYAHYTDGSVEDVTRRAQYDSNDTEVANVEASGLVRTLSLAGEAAIMARFQGQVTVFRATVPLSDTPPAFDFQPKTVVDEHTARKWRELALAPSEVCTDAEYLRRVSLDLTGTLPTPEQVRAFLADTAANKREKLVDRLLETPEYAYYFTNKWADILKVRRRQQTGRAYGTFAFHNWIRESIATDKPYDEFVREILGAVGDETKCPPAVWYKEIQTPEQFVDDAAQVFLGQRMACANCHHHPYEKWSQDDYWGLAAFFGRVGRKTVQMPGQSQNNQSQRQVIYSKATGSVTNKRTGKTSPMKPLDADAVEVGPESDPRHALADWMVSPKNPFFAKTVANRYWAHFFGRGIVDPLDDMRVTNPPSNPELLDALAKDLVDHKYSLKHLIRTIVTSRTYQLSSAPTDKNKSDKGSYARYYPKRLSAEVLFDAVSQVTGSPATFPGLPTDRYAPNRAIMLPDESFQSYFLDVFGRPQRISACECERVNEANLAQTLHLLNSEEVQQKLSRAGGRADQIAKDPRPDAEKVEELFLWAWGRKPTQEQRDLALASLAKNEKDKKAGFENIIWALLNSKSFQFNT